MNTRQTPTFFVLCADDYAMTPDVTRGILRLLDAKRISATGAMTNRPHWRAASRELRTFEGKADLGVHLNLTCGAPLTQMPNLAPGRDLPKLPSILLRGMAGALPLSEIAAEIAAQLTAFEDAMGRAPDFIDGHQHVHALPGVRRALATVLKDRYGAQKPYIRDAADSLAAIRARGVHANKAMLLAVLTKPFAAQMRELGFRLNKGFSGYSGFDAEADYGADFARYLVAPGEKHLVMCHPGEVDYELKAFDPAVDSRPNEVAFFLSSRFEEICAAAGMTMGRF